MNFSMHFNFLLDLERTHLKRRGDNMSTPEIKPDRESLRNIITKIDMGEVKLPPFQRNFVWNQDQIISLLDSIYKNYPIGCIIVWRCNERLPARKNIGGFQLEEKEPEYPIDYVLDGQQRLTTIYGVFCKDRVIAPSEGENTTDTHIFDIYFDMDEKKFVPDESKNNEHKNIKMSVLFNTTEFHKEITSLESRYQEIACDMYEKFAGYEIPVVLTMKREKSEVGVIFERINNSATRLSTIDLMVAWTWQEDFHLRNKFEEISEVLDEKDFGNIDDKILLQCLGAIIDNTAKTKDILSLSPEKVRNNIAKMQTGLEKTIDYLSTDLNMKSIDFLPHSHQIVSLVYLFSNITPNSEQVKVVKQWFWKTSFSRRYSGSTDEKVNEDIVFFDKVINNDYSGISKYSYDIDKNLLMNQKFSKSNPYTRAFLLLLAQKHPKDLVNGTVIELGKALSAYNRKEYHHIFPQKYLKGKGILINKINSLCNFTFLPTESNKTISSKSPSEYISAINKNISKDVLNTNLMPLNMDIYEKNNYDKFLDERVACIKQFLDSLLI